MGLVFFDLEETAIERADLVKTAPVKIYNCDNCSLKKGCKNPILPMDGSEKKGGILIVGEYPTDNDDKRGEIFSGDVGDILERVIQWAGISEKDFALTTCTACALNGTAPNLEFIYNCRETIRERINKKQPKVIIALGPQAMVSLVGDRLSYDVNSMLIGEWVGYQIPDYYYNAWIVTTWTPRWVLQYDSDWYLEKHMANHFKLAKSLINEPLPKRIEPKTELIFNEKRAIEIIKSASGDIVIDLETTSRKPQRKGQKIVCMSICYGETAYCFPWYDSPEFKQAVIEMGQKGIIGHNVKFESNWLTEFTGTAPRIAGDTMIAEHCINNQGRVGLKFLAYTYLGVESYNSAVDRFLTSSSAEDNMYGANGINNIFRAPREPLMQYCAEDSFYTYRIHQAQKGKGIQSGRDLFIAGTELLSAVERNGLYMDMEKFPALENEIIGKMRTAFEEIQTSPEMKHWDKRTPFRPTASADIAYLIYDKMKIKAVDFTKGGAPSTSATSLEKINTPIIHKIREWKKWQKAKDTYLMDFKRESVDGIIHPFFNLHNIVTFRSGSDSPNFQNIPKRQKDVKMALRSILKGLPGHKLAEYDYKAVEVCLDGDTLIDTIDGSIKLKEVPNLLKKQPVWVYSYSLEKKRIALSKVTDGGMTKKNAETIAVILDNGEEIIVTPTHKFLKRNGDYCEARFLSPGDSLMPLYKRIIKTKIKVNYREINLNNGSRIMEHNLVALDVYNTEIKGSNLLVHHKDSNGCNNSLSNLEIMHRKEHMRIHAIQSWTAPKKKRTFEYQKSKEGITKLSYGFKLYWESLSLEERKMYMEKRIQSRRSYKGENNPNFGKKYSEELKKKISNSRKAQGLTGEKSYWFGKTHTDEVKKRIGEKNRVENLSPERRKKMSDAQKGKKLTEETKKKLSIAGRGRIFSEETRKKLSDNKKRYWEDRKKEFNHKVVRIEPRENRDVYCITVEGTHNFAVSAGVIVHNCVSAAYNKDPMLIKYIEDPTTDMHRDMANQLFMTPACTKDERQLAKNKFVFPEFYGSYYAQVAPDLWEGMEDVTRERLFSKGIKNKEKYTDFVRDVENDFWKKRFRVYDQWKKDTYEQFQKKGYIDSYTGFRLHAPMKRNEVLNYPIQGSAFHCLLWTLIQVNKTLIKKKMESRIIGQIHDAGILSIHPDEEQEVDRLMWLWGTQRIREVWEWIIVPLSLEKSIAGTDESWADMKEIGLLKF